MDRPVGAAPAGRCRTVAHVLEVYTLRRTEATSDLVAAVLHDVASYASAKATAIAESRGAEALDSIIAMEAEIRKMPQERLSLQGRPSLTSQHEETATARSIEYEVSEEDLPPIPPRRPRSSASGAEGRGASISSFEHDDDDLYVANMALALMLGACVFLLWYFLTNHLFYSSAHKLCLITLQYMLSGKEIEHTRLTGFVHTLRRYEDISRDVPSPVEPRGVDSHFVELNNVHQLELMKMMKQGESEESILARAQQLKQDEMDAAAGM